MRVALIHWSLPPIVGGVETHLVDLANGLARNGTDVTVITGIEVPDRSLFSNQVTLSYEPLLSPSFVGHITNGNALDAIASFQNQLNSLKFDVIHAHNMFPLAGRDLAAALESVRRMTGAALIHTSHSEWDWESRWVDISNWNALLSVSSFLSDRLNRVGRWDTQVVDRLTRR